jgi:hypothetical protein
MQSAEDTLAITQLIVNERYNRDHRKWQQFRDAYFEDSIVRISWFNGSGWDFVKATQERFAGADIGMHFVSAVPVRLYGDRAVVTVPLSIQTCPTWQGVQVFINSVVVGFYGVEKRQGRWGICSFECSYIRDTIIPLIPGDEIPIDRQLLETLRPSYRYISYSLITGGHEVDHNLPGIDRPELVKEIEDRLEAWAHDNSTTSLRT